MQPNNLVNNPKYNILLKDDKTYPYIKIDVKSDYPNVIITRKVVNDGSKYFGPYASNEQVNEVIDLIRKTFRIRNCDKSFTPDHPAMNKCMYYDIHQCDAPCQGYISQEEYDAMIEKIKAAL